MTPRIGRSSFAVRLVRERPLGAIGGFITVALLFTRHLRRASSPRMA